MLNRWSKDLESLLEIGKDYRHNNLKMYAKLLSSIYVTLKQFVIMQPSLSTTLRQKLGAFCNGIGTVKLYGNCAEFIESI
jgi:hypothetical protein